MGSFSAPTEEDSTYLAKQWLGVIQLARDEYRVELDRSEASLDLLQRIIDDNLIEPTNTYGLQCLGMAFGHIMCEQFPGLDWWIIEDEYGRDHTLRYGQTSIQLNVLTMISKRIEDGKPVNVRELYFGTLKTIQQLIDHGEYQ